MRVPFSVVYANGKAGSIDASRVSALIADVNEDRKPIVGVFVDGADNALWVRGTHEEIAQLIAGALRGDLSSRRPGELTE